MSSFGKPRKYRSRGLCPAGLDVRQSFADSGNSFFSIGLGGRLRQFLVRRGILDYDLRLAVDREYQRLAAGVKLIQKLGGLPFEISQGIDTCIFFTTSLPFTVLFALHLAHQPAKMRSEFLE